MGSLLSHVACQGCPTSHKLWPVLVHLSYTDIGWEQSEKEWTCWKNIGSNKIEARAVICVMCPTIVSLDGDPKGAFPWQSWSDDIPCYYTSLSFMDLLHSVYTFVIHIKNKCTMYLL